MAAYSQKPLRWRLARHRALGGGGLVEDQLVAFDGHRDRLAFVQFALEDFLGQRVFEEPLDGAAHRARAVLRVVALLHQKVLGLVVQRELEVLVPQPRQDLFHFQAQNRDEVGLGERAEHNHVVEPVQEFGAEGLLGLVQNPFAHLLVRGLLVRGRKAERALLLDDVRADVRGHQDDGVAEIHHAADVVGQFALPRESAAACSTRPGAPFRFRRTAPRNRDCAAPSR